MPLIETRTKIKADIKTCFDLARDIDLYQKSLKKSNEIAIAGKTTGLVEANDFIVWEATHFGFVRHLNLKVTEFESPYLFVDEMVDGYYKAYKHEHIFKVLKNKNNGSSDSTTVMIDRFYFQSSFGAVGKVVDWLFLKRYMTKLLLTRNKLLKQQAESI